MSRTPCWCCGAAPDPDFEAPTCACTIFRCVIHRDDETCVACCRTLWGHRVPGEPGEPDDEDPWLPEPRSDAAP